MSEATYKPTAWAYERYDDVHRFDWVSDVSFYHPVDCWVDEQDRQDASTRHRNIRPLFEGSLIRWAHDTLLEINPNDYTDAQLVAALNAASVEVILGLAPYLGESHGKTDEWWSNYLNPDGPTAA